MKQADTGNQVESLFPDLESPLPLCLKVLLLWKAEQLFDLGLRVSKCLSALREYSDVPDETEMESFLSKCGKLKKAEFVQNAAAACAALGITTIEKSFSAVREALKSKIDKQQSLASLRFACFAASILYRCKQPLQENMLNIFIKLEHRLTNKTCESIGYWTAKLKEMKRNKDRGGAAKKKLGERNKEAIEKIIEELEITSLLVFKKDKILRNRFIDRAKEESKKVDEKYKTPLTEKRIMDISRSIIREKSTVMDTKPPV